MVQGNQADTRADLSPPCLRGSPACTLLRRGVQASPPFIMSQKPSQPVGLVSPPWWTPGLDAQSVIQYTHSFVDVHLCNLPFPLESLPSGVGSDPFTFLLFLLNYVCIFLTVFFV